MTSQLEKNDSTLSCYVKTVHVVFHYVLCMYYLVTTVARFTLSTSVADPDPVFFGHPDPDPLSTKRPHVILIFSL